MINFDQPEVKKSSETASWLLEKPKDPEKVIKLQQELATVREKLKPYVAAFAHFSEEVPGSAFETWKRYHNRDSGQLWAYDLKDEELGQVYVEEILSTLLTDGTANTMELREKMVPHGDKGLVPLKYREIQFESACRKVQELLA